MRCHNTELWNTVTVQQKFPPEIVAPFAAAVIHETPKQASAAKEAITVHTLIQKRKPLYFMYLPHRVPPRSHSLTDRHLVTALSPAANDRTQSAHRSGSVGVFEKRDPNHCEI